MTTPNHLPSRRTVLKAASAAGIVWASPVLQSVPAHAASVCTSVQFNNLFTAEVTTDPALDGSLAGCPTVPACDLSGTGSLCTCNSFTVGAPAGGGSWSGLTYTAPTGCTIVAANLRRSTPGASGCALQWPCVTSGITISADNKSVTFPAAPVVPFSINWKYRIILCCTT